MFVIERLLNILIGTFLCFNWIFRLKDSIAKFSFLFMMAALIIYSGIGGAMEDVPEVYVVYYLCFATCTSLGLYYGQRIFNKRRRDKSWIQWDKYLDYFIDHKASKIIAAYYLILLFNLIVPEFKLMNLIKPPSPDVLSVLEARYSGENNSSTIISLISYVGQILYPFFLLSLYKYRKSSLKIAILILGTYYISYCKSGYIGRGSMLEALIIIVAYSYMFRPKLGKKIILLGAIFAPLILVFLVKYSITRIGGSAADLSSSEATEILLSQESSYPQHFPEILKHNGQYVFNYFVWLFTMPLPGFFRGGIDANFNVLFSEHLLGMARSDRGFFILLPGLVGESVFLLGKYLFWINGIIYGLIMGLSFRILRNHIQLFGILIVAVVDLSYVANRGGLVSAVPFILKILVYFYLILYILKNREFKKNI